MSEPTTAAGRALLGDATYEDDGEWIVACYNEALPERIIAIEAEARAAALDEARAALDGLRYGASGPDTMWLRCAAAIDALRRDEG